jgi:hypothetical protein
LTTFAQVPQGFSFQGVAFDDIGDPLSESEISIKIQIIDTDVNGVAVYSELHDITTSSQGLYSLQIGMGNTESGQFSDIEWLADLKFIRVSIDYDASGEYEVVGTNQFLSVPYALAAGSAPVESKIYVTSPESKPQMIIKNGNDYDGQGSIRYQYQWIDGLPEDLFIEFSGLPNNIAIYTNSRGGFGLNSVIKNTTNVDTIIDGVLKPSSFLGINDINLEVPKGIYPIELTFKTETKTFKTLNDTLVVYGIAYEDCFTSLPSTYTLDSVSCDSLQSLFNEEITLDESSLNSVSVTPIFQDNYGGSGDSSISFPQFGECNEATSNSYFYFNTYNVELEEFMFLGSEIHYTFKLTEFGTNEETECTVIYKQ